jgi:hypothetical protein
MKRLLASSPSNEIMRDYADMLLAPCRMRDGRNEACRGQAAEAIAVLGDSPFRRQARWNLLWIEAHLVSGERSTADAGIDYLRSIGCRHPALATLVGRHPARTSD